METEMKDSDILIQQILSEDEEFMELSGINQMIERNDIQTRRTPVKEYLRARAVVKKHKRFIFRVCKDLASDFEGYIMRLDSEFGMKEAETLSFEELFLKSLSVYTRRKYPKTIKRVLDEYKLNH